MSQVARCQKGHYYDVLLYPHGCPHCQDNSGFSWEETAEEKQMAAKIALAYVRGEEIAEGDLFPHSRPDPEEDEATVAWIKAIHSQDPLQGRAAPQMEPGFDPPLFPTGWLVCMKGPLRGKSFSLSFEYNQLPQEPGFGLIYERKKNCFFVIGREEGIYLNGTALEVDTTESSHAAFLQSGDQLRTRENTYVFIAFCQDSRRWEEEDWLRFRQQGQ